MESVPPVTEFPTVDALRADLTALAHTHPGTCTVRRIGTSRLGEPIDELVIGSGPVHAVIVGGVHPNEPVGSVTATHLARTLAENPALLVETGYTWHIVGCIDPDGMRLNEGWFAGPFTRRHYGRHFYRPAFDEQVEWTFPLSYKDSYFDAMLPETVALMRLVDDTRPAFMCTLHNSELGGVYYYLSRPEPALYGTLHAIPAAVGLPLDTGRPETPHAEQLEQAIFRMPHYEDEYEFMLEAGFDPRPAAGSSSADYAAKYGTLSLITEVPYWTNRAAGDNRPTDTSFAQALTSRADGLRATADFLDDVLIAVGPDLRADSVFLRAAREFLPVLRQSADADAHHALSPQAARPATAAEVFSCVDSVHCFRLRYGGILLRALDGELATGNLTPRIRAQHARLTDTYRRWGGEADEAAGEDTITIDIADLVAVQYAAILAGAAHARTGCSTEIER
ncbi:hypothetical protein AXA44_45675 [Rhodococcus sp. SC4]|nr:hypothetical protein AXA44_45675 [Rhodococcus sp. SC4]